MIHINGAIVVEGKYDKIRLSGMVDCPIIVTEGFGIFKNDETKALLRWYAKNGGITILTDSDSAGFKIRGYIKGIISSGEIRNVYIPDVFGKEKRKLKPSAEGKLGVEGMSGEALLAAFTKAGVIGERRGASPKITRADLFDDGLFGGRDSSAKRQELLRNLGLPENLSTSGLLNALNSFMSFDEYKNRVKSL